MEHPKKTKHSRVKHKIKFLEVLSRLLKKRSDEQDKGELPSDTDVWEAYLDGLKTNGIAEPGLKQGTPHLKASRKPATLADEVNLYHVGPSFVELLPWVEYLSDAKAMLLDDGQSVAAFFELLPIGTEGREDLWLQKVRDALENALQDSFDEDEDQSWVIQLYAQDECNWDGYLNHLNSYVQPRAKGSEFTDYYLRFFKHHLYAIAKPGGLFEDKVVTRLPWRGQTRKVRLVVYRKHMTRRNITAEQALNIVCDRLTGGLMN